MKDIKIILKSGDRLKIFYDASYFDTWCIYNHTKESSENYPTKKDACEQIEKLEIKNMAFEIESRDEFYFQDGKKIHKAGTFNIQPYKTSGKISFYWQFVTTKGKVIAEENLAHRFHGFKSMYELINMMKDVYWMDKNLKKLAED